MNEWGKITWTTGIAPSRKQVARPKIWGKIPDALAGQKKNILPIMGNQLPQ